MTSATKTGVNQMFFLSSTASQVRRIQHKQRRVVHQKRAMSKPATSLATLRMTFPGNVDRMCLGANAE